MALEVGLVDDVEPVEVAQVQKARVGRVVGSPDGVDVVPFHGDHVAHHGRQGHRSPAVGVELVAVHAPKGDRLAVEEEPAVAPLDVAETRLDGDYLDDRAVTGCGEYTTIS